MSDRAPRDRVLYCRRCRMETAWRPGRALVNTPRAGASDFPSDSEANTYNLTGIDLIEVLKCTECGRSVSMGDDNG